MKKLFETPEIEIYNCLISDILCDSVSIKGETTMDGNTPWE